MSDRLTVEYRVYGTDGTRGEWKETGVPARLNDDEITDVLENLTGSPYTEWQFKDGVPEGRYDDEEPFDTDNYPDPELAAERAADAWAERTYGGR